MDTFKPSGDINGRNDVLLTSMQRNNFAPTSVGRSYDVMRLLGDDYHFKICISSELRPTDMKEINLPSFNNRTPTILFELS